MDVARRLAAPWIPLCSKSQLHGNKSRHSPKVAAACRFHSCAVTSKKDWHCRSSTDDSFELGYRDGQPWLRIKGSEETDLVFLPRWQYLWLKSGEPHGNLAPKQFQFRK